MSQFSLLCVSANSRTSSWATWVKSGDIHLTVSTMLPSGGRDRCILDTDFVGSRGCGPEVSDSSSANYGGGPEQGPSWEGVRRREDLRTGPQKKVHPQTRPRRWPNRRGLAATLGAVQMAADAPRQDRHIPEPPTILLPPVYGGSPSAGVGVKPLCQENDRKPHSVRSGRLHAFPGPLSFPRIKQKT